MRMTVAPGSTPPCWSLMVPSTVVVTCADAGDASAPVRMTTHAITRIFPPCRSARCQRQHAVLPRLGPPQVLHRFELFRFLCREIAGLGVVVRHVVELPGVLLVRRARRVNRDGPPAVVVDRALAAELEHLRVP